MSASEGSRDRRRGPEPEASLNSRWRDLHGVALTYSGKNRSRLLLALLWDPSLSMTSVLCVIGTRGWERRVQIGFY